MKDNQAFNIYIRAKKVKVPVSEEVFKIYMRENDAFRRRMQRSGQCKCPTDKSTGCDTDCESCRFFHEKVDVDSLDASVSEEESLEGDYYELTISQCTEPWDLMDGETCYARQERMIKMLTRLKQIMPEAEAVGQMRLEGKTISEIAQELGMKKDQLIFRLQRMRRILKYEFKDWL